MNNFFNMMNALSQFRSNPMSIIGKRFNIPQNIQNPEDIVNHLINSGQVSQEQVNQAMQMRNNPMMQNLFRK